MEKFIILETKKEGSTQYIKLKSREDEKIDLFDVGLFIFNEYCFHNADNYDLFVTNFKIDLAVENRNYNFSIDKRQTYVGIIKELIPEIKL